MLQPSCLQEFHSRCYQKHMLLEQLFVHYFLLNNKILTIKSISNNNLGAKYKINNKNFWMRRNQQIKYWELISKNKIYNIDKIITKLVNIII